MARRASWTDRDRHSDTGLAAHQASPGSSGREPPKATDHGVGFAHRHTLVDIDVHETEFHIYDHVGEPLTVIPRNSRKEVTWTMGYGVCDTVG